MYRIGFKGYRGERLYCEGQYETESKAQAKLDSIKRMLPRSMKEAIDLRVEEVVEVSN